MELGMKIKTLRLKAGLTQEQLAEKLGIGPQSVSKWENAVAMPDISTLPLLSEIFGVTIDDLFDLSTEQRFNRIESRMDREGELPRELFTAYEEFLKAQLCGETYKKRATELLATLYWHRMNSYANKADNYAKESVRMAPDEKGCRWILQKTDGHVAWDWNVANHHKAVDFYRELVKGHPEDPINYAYLLDNLIADHRTEEAEETLRRLSRLKSANPVLNEVFRAHIALARFDEAAADGIMDALLQNHPENSVCLFEAAQYYAAKCDYRKAIDCYERSFRAEKRRPRYQDELQAIAMIYEIMGDYPKAAATYDRIIDLLRKEWGMTEETGLKEAQKEKARLLAKAQ